MGQIQSRNQSRESRQRNIQAHPMVARNRPAARRNDHFGSRPVIRADQFDRQLVGRGPHVHMQRVERAGIHIRAAVVVRIQFHPVVTQTHIGFQNPSQPVRKVTGRAGGTPGIKIDVRGIRIHAAAVIQGQHVRGRLRRRRRIVCRRGIGRRRHDHQIGGRRKINVVHVIISRRILARTIDDPAQLLDARQIQTRRDRLELAQRQVEPDPATVGDDPAGRRISNIRAVPRGIHHAHIKAVAIGSEHIHVQIRAARDVLRIALKTNPRKQQILITFHHTRGAGNRIVAKTAPLATPPDFIEIDPGNIRVNR